jgi:hypothetical protein
LQGIGNELGAIVHPQMGRGWMVTEQFLDGSNHIRCFATPADTNGQASTTEFIDNIEEL